MKIAPGPAPVAPAEVGRPRETVDRPTDGFDRLLAHAEARHDQSGTGNRHDEVTVSRRRSQEREQRPDAARAAVAAADTTVETAAAITGARAPSTPGGPTTGSEADASTSGDAAAAPASTGAGAGAPTGPASTSTPGADTFTATGGGETRPVANDADADAVPGSPAAPASPDPATLADTATAADPATTAAGPVEVIGARATTGGEVATDAVAPGPDPARSTPERTTTTATGARRPTAGDGPTGPRTESTAGPGGGPERAARVPTTGGAAVRPAGAAGAPTTTPATTPTTAPAAAPAPARVTPTPPASAGAAGSIDAASAAAPGAPGAAAPSGPTGATPAAPPAPVPDPAPHAQVVAFVAPLRSQADGTHKLTLQLAPPELGRVEVDVHIQAGEVRVHLRAADAAASSLLHESLGELRRGLEAQGLRVADVAVDTRAHDRSDPHSARNELEGRDDRAGIDGRGASDDGARPRSPTATDPAGSDAPAAPTGLHQLDLHL